MLPENSLEGSYHGHFIHKFAFDLFDSRSGRDRMDHDEDSTRYMPGGHMVEDFRGVQYHPRQEPSPARKAYVEMLIKTYGAERTESLTFGRAPILFVFPNLMFVQTHIRRLQPISVNETHVYYQPVMLKGVPPQINQEILRSHETSFGPAGFLVARRHRGHGAQSGRSPGAWATNGFLSVAAFIAKRSLRTAQPSATTWTKISCAGFGGIMLSS